MDYVVEWVAGLDDRSLIRSLIFLLFFPINGFFGRFCSSRVRRPPAQASPADEETYRELFRAVCADRWFRFTCQCLLGYPEPLLQQLSAAVEEARYGTCLGVQLGYADRATGDAVDTLGLARWAPHVPFLRTIVVVHEALHLARSVAGLTPFPGSLYGTIRVWLEEAVVWMLTFFCAPRAVTICLLPLGALWWFVRWYAEATVPAVGAVLDAALDLLLFAGLVGALFWMVERLLALFRGLPSRQQG